MGSGGGGGGEGGFKLHVWTDGGFRTKRPPRNRRFFNHPRIMIKFIGSDFLRESCQKSALNCSKIHRKNARINKPLHKK